MNTKSFPKAMTIAGSDSGAGAGIQADLKTFSALGVYGTTVITALTAQNTVGVQSVLEVSPEFISAQIDSVMSDIGADSAKTGMLANSSVIEAVASGVRKWRITNLVVDPVMVAKSGDPLLKDDSVSAMVDSLFPLACVITPNIPEAEKLTGGKIETVDDMKRAARDLKKLGPKCVVLKGGHLGGSAETVDVFFDGHEFTLLKARRYNTRNTHGTGCTFSAAIAAFLARGEGIASAVKNAKSYITAAISKAFSIGRGHGPVNHFYNF